MDGVNSRKLHNFRNQPRKKSPVNEGRYRVQLFVPVKRIEMQVIANPNHRAASCSSKDRRPAKKHPGWGVVVILTLGALAVTVFGFAEKATGQALQRSVRARDSEEVAQAPRTAERHSSSQLDQVNALFGTPASPDSENVLHLKPTATLRGHGSWTFSLAYSPDGTQLASGSNDQHVVLWNTQNGKQLNRVRAHPGIVASLAWTPDGKSLVTCANDHKVKTWDPETLEERFVLQGHDSIVDSLSLEPLGKYVLSGGGDGTVRIWSLADGKETGRLKCPHRPIHSVAVHPKAQITVAGTSTGALFQWSKLEDPPKRIGMHEAAVRSVKFSPNGQLMATGGLDGAVGIWTLDARTWNRQKTLTLPDSQVYSVAFSPDGRLLAAAGGKWKFGEPDAFADVPGSILIWDVATGQRIAELAGHEKCVFRVLFSPDGKQLASGSADKQVLLWDVGELPLFAATGITRARSEVRLATSPPCTLRLERVLQKETAAPESALGYALAASAGRLVAGDPLDDAAGRNAGGAYVFDLPTGRPLHKLHSPEPGESFRFGTVVGISENHIAAGSYRSGGEVALFDGSDGKLVRTVHGPRGKDGPAHGMFGFSLAVNNDSTFVGSIRASDDDADVKHTGAIHRIDHEHGILQRMPHPKPAEGDTFGWTSLYRDGKLLVGAPKHDAGARDTGGVFILDAGTGKLLRELQLPEPVARSQVGVALAAAGDFVVVGAPRQPFDRQELVGAVYLFHAKTGKLLHRFRKPKEEVRDLFGWSIAISEQGLVFVGAPFDDQGAADAGAVYIFSTETGDLLHVLQHPQPAAKNLFGHALAVDGQFLAVGAPYDDLIAKDAGAVYVYRMVAAEEKEPADEEERPDQVEAARNSE